MRQALGIATPHCSANSKNAWLAAAFHFKPRGFKTHAATAGLHIDGRANAFFVEVVHVKTGGLQSGAGAVHEAGRAADVDLTLGKVGGHGLQHGCIQVASEALAFVLFAAACQAHMRFKTGKATDVGVGHGLRLVIKDQVFGGAGAVEERHVGVQLAVMYPAHHRQHGRDATARRQRQQLLARLGCATELAVRVGHAQCRAHLHVVTQLVGNGIALHPLHRRIKVGDCGGGDDSLTCACSAGLTQCGECLSALLLLQSLQNLSTAICAHKDVDFGGNNGNACLLQACCYVGSPLLPVCDRAV